MTGVQRAASLYAVDGATVRRNEPRRPRARPAASRVHGGRPRPARRRSSATLALGPLPDRGDRALPDRRARRVAAPPPRHHRRRPAQPQVWIGDRYFTVVGILDPVTLDASIDRAALIGLPAAQARSDTDANPAKIYLRADDDRARRRARLLAATANPEHPEEVEVSRPSDALEAKAAAEGAFTSLLLGLGAVALLVGGVGIANVMVISVLERRSEIGLRRALGATRRHITVAVPDRVAAAVARSAAWPERCSGALVTVAYATAQDQPTVVPPRPSWAASRPRWSSARSPGSTPRCAPRGCRRPRRSEPSRASLV